MSKTSKSFSNELEVDVPNEEYYKILELLVEISRNNRNNFDRLKKKIIYRPKRILRRREHLTDDERSNRLARARKVIEKRRKIVKEYIDKHGFTVKDLKRTLVTQKQAQEKFDDRKSIKEFEKAMAMYAVDIGFERTEIAQLLDITSKHMKDNIHGTDFKVRNHNLQFLDWFNCCPNCGVRVADILETKVDDFRNGVGIDYDDEELDLLKMTTYQKKIVDLNKRIRKLAHELKVRKNG